jgi:hypothetical protein
MTLIPSPHRRRKSFFQVIQKWLQDSTSLSVEVSALIGLFLFVQSRLVDIAKSK